MRKFCSRKDLLLQRKLKRYKGRSPVLVELKVPEKKSLFLVKNNTKKNALIVYVLLMFNGTY